MHEWPHTRGNAGLSRSGRIGHVAMLVLLVGLAAGAALWLAGALRWSRPEEVVAPAPRQHGSSASEDAHPPAPEAPLTKAGDPAVDPNVMPADIRQRVAADFGPEQADGIYRHLLDRIPEGLPNGTRPRHLRCILFLAKGDRVLLDRYIEMCRQDTRDVMLNAEYEAGLNSELVRVRDFARPFDQAQIGPTGR